VGTLPSGCLSTAHELSSSLGRFHRFRLRARLGLPLSVYPGQRGVTPAFGYDAPYPGASGTSTHPIWALPSTHYGPIRHLFRPTPALTGSLLMVRATETTTGTDFPCSMSYLARAYCHHYPGGITECGSRSLPQ
jgi:hypothetical protein